MIAPAALRRWRPPLAIAAGAATAPVLGYAAAARSPLLAGGALGAALVGVWTLRRFEVALGLLVAIIALLPFGVVPLRAGVSPTFLDCATALVFLVWLARASARRCGTRLTPSGAALAGFAVTLVGAYVLSGETALHLDETARQFAKVVMAHLLFIPVVNLVATRRLAGQLIAWLILVSAAEGAVGVAQYAAPRGLAVRALNSLGAIGYPTGDSVLRFRPDTDILRATGTSVDPNMLGALLMVAAALGALQLLARSPVLPKWLIGAALVPTCLCLLLTESRGSWLGLLAGLLVIGALRYRRLWPAVLAVAALAMLLPQAQRFTEHLFAGLRAEDRASAMRIGELQNALSVISSHPWFGVGWGMEGKSIALDFVLGVSNVYLAVAERAGVIALVTYLAALAVLAVTFWRALRQPALPDDGLLPGLVAALAAAQVAGLVDHHFVSFPHLVSLLWLLAALAVRLSHEPAAALPAPDPAAAPAAERWAPLRRAAT